MKIKKNQVLMTEGVLPYVRKDGSISYKLKTWGNLKEFIGEVPYITDEHPEGKQIATSTPLFGNTIVHQCPNGAKSLCGVVNLDENAPTKLGYSPGYSYVDKKESGVFKGQKYDSIQEITRIDHIALTDFPRNTQAIATDKMGKIFEDVTATIGADSISSEAVNKYNFAYDSVRPFEFETISDKIEGDKEMPDELKELNKTIIAQNKTIAEFQAREIANDAFKKDMEKQKVEIDSLTEKLKKTTNAFDSMKTILELQQKSKMKSAIDSLIKGGVKPEALKDKSWDYIQGRVDQLGEDKKTPTTEVSIKDLKDGDSPNPLAVHNTNDYTWNGTKWELKKGVTP